MSLGVLELFQWVLIAVSFDCLIRLLLKFKLLI